MALSVAAEPRTPVGGWRRRLASSILRAGRWAEVDLDSKKWRIPLSAERGLELFALLLVASGLAATVSAVLGLFRFTAPLIYVGWLVVLGLLAWAVARKRIAWRGGWHDGVALALAAVAFLATGLLHHNFFIAQSDIGFYASDAGIIASTGGREISRPFDRVLPGFTYHPDGTSFVSAMFGYTSYGALFVFLGGRGALGWANAPLAALTVLSLYRVGRFMGARGGALLGAAFYMTCLITLWLSRWFMTENLASALFWVAVVIALPLFHRWDAWRAAALTLTLTYASFVRAEGLFVFLWFGALLAIWHRAALWASLTQLALRWRLHVEWSRRRVAWVVVGALATLVFAVRMLTVFPTGYFSGNLVHALGAFGSILRGRPIADAPDVATTGPSPNWGDYAFRYEWESALAYLLPWFLLVGVAGLALGLVPWRRAWIPAALSAPYLLFVVMPPVTTTHPWFMRRLWVAFIPLIFVLAGATLDLWRAGRRWPLTIDGRIEARLPVSFLAAALAGVLLIAQLGIVGPIAFKNEEDGLDEVLPWVSERVPPDAAIIVDEDAVRYSSALRIHHGYDTVTWFIARTLAFNLTLQASASHERIFLLRVPPDQGQLALATDPEGVLSSERFSTTIEFPQRFEHRNYLSFAPLSQGYKPMADYLRDWVPPNKWQVNQQGVELIELRQPAVLAKNIDWAPGDWVRTPDGLRAERENARLQLDLGKFVSNYLVGVPLALHLIAPQVDIANRTVSASDGVSLRALEPPVVSDGSGGLRMTIIPLPVPMTLSEFYFPEGTVLRGIYFGLLT